MGKITRNFECCVCNRRKRTHPGVKFHLFPSDRRRALHWAKVLQVALGTSSNQAVCEDHFSPIHIGTKGRLLSIAIPYPRDGVEESAATEVVASTSANTSIDVEKMECDSSSHQIQLPQYDQYDTSFGSVTEDSLQPCLQNHDHHSPPPRADSLHPCANTLPCSDGDSYNIDFGVLAEELGVEGEAPRIIQSSPEQHGHVQPYTEKHNIPQLPSDQPGHHLPAAASHSDGDSVSDPPETFGASESPSLVPEPQSEMPAAPGHPQPVKASEQRKNYSVSDPPETFGASESSSFVPEPLSEMPAAPGHPQLVTPSKQRKYRRQIKLLQNNISRLKKRLEKMKLLSIKTPKELLTRSSDYLNPRLLRFFKWQILHSVENDSERKYGIQEKSFALALYYESSKAYKFLSSLFYLPPVQTLQSSLKTHFVGAGWSKHSMIVLKNRAESLPKEETLCGIVFGSMSVKESFHFDSVKEAVIGSEGLGHNGTSLDQANRVVVFMVRGLVEKWTMVLGCFFHTGEISTSNLKELYKESVRRVQSTGNRVIFTVCDQEEKAHHSLFQALGLTRGDPSLEVKGEKVHFFYDSPHLLRSLTNTLLSYDMKIKGATISWDHIKQFIEVDERQKIRLEPRLTNTHVCGDGSSQIGGTVAAQVMSRSVAAGIYTHCVLGMLPKEAVHTAEFIQQVDKLFLLLYNSRALQVCEVTGGGSSNSSHQTVISEATAYLSSLEVCGPPDVWNQSVEGWLINLASLQAVCQELNTYKVKCLLTSQLSHDCLENLFTKLRDQYGKCRCLTAHNFLKGLRSIIINDLVEVPESDNSKTENLHFCDISTNWESEFPYLSSDTDSLSEDSDEYDDLFLMMSC